MIQLRKVAEDATTITLAWDTPAGDMGYVFYADGKRVSWTSDPARTSVRLAKGASRYRVRALANVDEGEYPAPASSVLWAASSPINTPIPANPQVVLGYGQGVLAGLPGIGLHGGGWNVAVFRDTSGTRRTITNSGGWKLDNVPRPAQWQAYYDAMAAIGDSERHFVLFDDERVYDVYGVNRDFTTASSAIGCYRTSGSGFWNNPVGPWAGRASGFSSAAGVLLKHEVEAGLVEHALAVCWPKERIRGDAGGSRPGSFVPPATSSDGSGGDTGVPMGSRLQLDPSLTDSQLLAFGISQFYLPVAKAMQRYGAYVGDSSNVMRLYTEVWNDSGRVTWPSGWHPGSTKLVPYLRVVAPPAAPVYDDRTVFGQPHR